MFKRNLQYLSYVIRHKWFVFLAGIKLRVPIYQLIIHDWSKFTYLEWTAYRDFFYSEESSYKRKRFTLAWNSHQKRNPHHWQYWVIINDDGNINYIEMPDNFIREMVADWKGAGLALGKPDTKAWYEEHKERILMHVNTRVKVEQLLGEL
jgi:hypothetical protein